MILPDSKIRELFEEEKIYMSSSYSTEEIMKQIGPASFDFRLGYTFKYYKKEEQGFIDTKKICKAEHKIKTITLKSKDEPFIIHPGDFVLGSTLEKFKIAEDLVARCEGRSSLGRLGLIIHSTAGFIDPGFEGTITLEMTNINTVPIILYPEMLIGQLTFETLAGECEVPYNKRPQSKYMGQIEPEVSRIHLD